MEKEFWDKRWEEGNTGWDMGSVSPPLKSYFEQLNNKDISILIPGCGNAYEAEYLLQNGFKNVFIVEISDKAIASFRSRCPEFPENQIFHGDFFKSDTFNSEVKFDLIVEQTFFCAIHPSMRPNYAKRMSELLKPGGKLMGLLFDFPLESGPPFGGSEAEYRTYFEPLFDILIMERAYNSIKPRQEREFFILMKN